MPIHVVRAGDTLSSIARTYGVPIGTLYENNGLTESSRLVVGQAILVLIPQTTYTVSAGDTLYSIARRYDTTVMALMQNNPGTAAQSIVPGQLLVIAYDTTPRRTLNVNCYTYPGVNRTLLIRTLPYLTYLTIFSYGFQNDGTLIIPQDEALIDLAYRFQVAPVLLLSSVTSDGRFDNAKLSVLFRNQGVQDRVIQGLLSEMRRKGYLGLDVDFEYVQAEDKDAYLLFLRKITAQMNAAGFFVNVDLAPKTSGTQTGLLYEAHDYDEIGAIADTVLLMTYEWGYTYGPPMAVAPLNRVREVAEYAVSVIPPEKIQLGIPNYGYDWQLPYIRGTTAAETVGNAEAVEIAAANRAAISFDETARSPFFEYTADSGAGHIVWFEDVRSIEGKLALADQLSLSGVGVWNALRSFPALWSYLGAYYRIPKIT